MISPSLPTFPQIAALVALADESLPEMQNANGLVCYERSTDGSRQSINDRPRRGESVRYSLITLLGLLRANQSGRSTSIEIEPLRNAIAGREQQLGLGDTALQLWADVRAGSDRAGMALDRLGRQAELTPLDTVEGLEIAWWVIAASEAVAAGLDADRNLAHTLAVFTSRRSKRSPLYRHYGAGWRAPLPNFATEIYSLLALANLVRHKQDDRAEPWAVELAEFLIDVRTPDHGWPWLYDSERACVIERYEIYSVHQDAMAPMALLALTEATGMQKFARAALEGLTWCHARNEMGAAMVDYERQIINRSIRRRRQFQRVNQLGNVALGSWLRAPASVRLDLGGVEINRTCRPYHLGWILEAWCGRDYLVKSVLRGDNR